MNCKVCGSDIDNKKFIIREMMFGLRDEFSYFECAKCGCLQITEIPKNIEKYHPLNYYSFKKADKSKNFLKQILRLKRDKYAFWCD